MSSDKSSMASQFEGQQTGGGGGRRFTAVAGQMGGRGTRVATPQQLATPEGMTEQEYQDQLQATADRAKARIQGQYVDANAEGAEQDEEEVQKEVERILNLHSAVPNRVTQEAAARLRDAYQNPTGSPSA